MYISGSMYHTRLNPDVEGAGGGGGGSWFTRLVSSWRIGEWGASIRIISGRTLT